MHSIRSFSNPPLSALRAFSVSISIALCLITLASFSGCANLVRQQTLRDQLRDHGPQPLSGNNPYLASNLLLTEEMQKSDTLRGFVKLRGAPDAIEVRRPLFKPYRLYFFYLDNNEGYLLEELRDAWIIRGPEQIPEEVKGSLKSVTPLGGKAALGKKKVAKLLSLKRSLQKNP